MNLRILGLYYVSCPGDPSAQVTPVNCSILPVGAPCRRRAAINLMLIRTSIFLHATTAKRTAQLALRIAVLGSDPSHGLGSSHVLNSNRRCILCGIAKPRATMLCWLHTLK